MDVVLGWLLRIHEDRQPRPRHQLARILLDEADDEHSAELVQVLSDSAGASNPIRIAGLAKLLDKGRGITPVNARQRIKKARKTIAAVGRNADWEIKYVRGSKGYHLLEKRLGLEDERRV